MSDQGFTLIELLIVTSLIPIIVGALAAGLFAMFSLQSSVANRLSNSADSQVVEASFRTDVQSAAYITTNPNDFSSQCGTGTQLLGLEWNLNSATHHYQTVVTYVSVPVTSGSTTTYSLVRQYCTLGSLTPVRSTTISSNLESGQLAPTVYPVPNSASSAWIDAQGVTGVSFQITEPEAKGTAYTYTLVAAPATNASAIDLGGPISVNTTAGCGYASAGSGTYASSLCLVDLTALTGNNLVAATQGCLEVSVPLPGGSTLYFCLGLSGAPVAPYALPTWTDGFLGNSINGVPFYSDIPGDPALYQSCEGDSSTCVVNGVSVPNTWGGVTTISISNITVVAPNGNPATGWEFVSADAESTDSGESIQWTTGPASSTNPTPPPLYLIPNGEGATIDPPGDPIGNACNSGAGVVPQSALAGLTSTTPTTTITCDGDSNGVKTGTAMVEALTPSSMTVTMVGTGLEGVSLGLLF
jgi:prepilin-type N-terminal cleavage/methylation domain-containing protein